MQTAQTDCTDCADLTCQDGFADDAFAFAEQYADFFQAKIEVQGKTTKPQRNVMNLCDSHKELAI